MDFDEYEDDFNDYDDHMNEEVQEDEVEKVHQTKETGKEKAQVQV